MGSREDLYLGGESSNLDGSAGRGYQVFCIPDGLDQWFPSEGNFALQGKFGNVWKHVWFLQPRECY